MSGPASDEGAALRSASGTVHLEPVTAETVLAVCALTVSPDQEHFVTANAVSLAEASFHQQAWHRAVYAGDGLVGFVMLHDAPTGPGYMLWRLMIDHRYQGRGYGRQVVRLVADHVRTRPGARTLAVGARRGAGGPRPFYESLGFVATGEVIDGDEDVLTVELGAVRSP